MALLELAEVVVHRGAARVVDGVSLTVGEGEIVCVVGPNGAGKSSLLLAAAGLLPAAGEIRAGGDDPARGPRRALARRLALLPQEVDVVFPFTVREIVLMGRYAHRGLLAREGAGDRRLAAAALAEVDVVGLEGRRWDELSGGERRRVLLAQALCQGAPLLLLDEPTAALDPGHALRLFGTLRRAAAEGHGALVATHDLNLALRFADRVLVLCRGRAAALGAPEAIRASLAEVFATRFFEGRLPDGGPFVVPLEVPR